MQITLEILDELAASLAPCGAPARVAVEALKLEAYRRRRISSYQFRMLLGIPSRWDLDAFLKQHQVETYTAEDFDNDPPTIQRLDVIPKAEHRA